MILEARQLDFSYADGTPALRGIDLKIKRGGFTVLLGPNGSGKTTLFKVLTGLVRPVRGEVCLAGSPVGKMAREDLYRRIGFVFQDPNDQLFAPTVLEDVSFGPANLGLTPRQVAERAEAALGRVGMWPQRDKPVHCLSYGQKKRAAIAGVLAMEPGVIILDEPTAGLDPAGVREIMTLLAELHRRHGITVLMATHDVDLVPLYATDIFVLNEGRIVASGSPQEVFGERATIRRAGLRLPRITHLWEILQSKDHLPLNGFPLTIGEARRQLLKVMEGEGSDDR
ncbi:MAG: energy-coupling factor ABC transporter ATP-binding protein [Bacillota bacterium]